MVSQTEVVRKAPKRRGSIHWVEVFTLQVLNQRQLGRLPIIHQLDNGWDFRPAKLVHRAPTAFASDQFKASSCARKWPNHHWLHQPGLLDTASQGVERNGIHAAARLVLAWLDSSNGEESNHSVGQL
jgi:hypothetical protein